jgi:hypothetical protein
VAGKGEYSRGLVVLVGTNPSTRTLAWLWRAKALIRAGCPADVAGVAAKTGHGMEEAVWRGAVALLARRPLPPRPRSGKEWELVLPDIVYLPMNAKQSWAAMLANVEADGWELVTQALVRIPARAGAALHGRASQV